MSVPALLMRPFSRDPCADAPSITSISKTTDELNNCPSGWFLEWTVNISGTLQPTQEYYWEHAVDSGGTSWSYWRRGTAALQSKSLPIIGADGPGGSQTHYHRVRAYVVPVDESPPNECSGPTTGTQASRTANSCAG